MKRVLVSDTLEKEGIEIFKNAPGIEVDVKTGLTPGEMKDVIKNYDGLAIRSATKVTEEIIDAAGKLKVIGRAGIGLDNVAVDAASKKGIVVMNTPGGNTITTAEHAIAMMLSLARRIPQATASTKAGKWEKKKFMGSEVSNKTLGIIGIGRVGSIVANRAQGLTMNVMAYDPFISYEAAEKMGIALAPLDEVLQKADFISVHTPLTEETRGLINAASFAKMKDGVFVINCARGGIVDEDDLYDALLSGKVAGAALDVFVDEPTTNTKLLSLDNIICTPHLGASTDEAQRNVAIAIAQQIVDYLTKGEIKNAVNFPSVSAETLALIKPYLTLGEKIGDFVAQIVVGGITEVAIEYSGSILEHNVAPVTVSFLKGFLTPALKENVNYINAPIIARERGISIIESKSSEVKDYKNMISVTVKTDQEAAFAAGAIFGREDLRIVRINQFVLDVIPEGSMLMLYNHDRPGVIGNIATTLGDDSVNIARLHLSREQVDGKALVVLSTDTPVSKETMTRLRGLPNIISVIGIEM
ncbi:MAG: phosphoglycerate dehydrogenase [Deltaproteobacteria bacterium]|nr:phosphoglycerate dehydrogenase [Deltaproteobacteria bacterium]